MKAQITLLILLIIGIQASTQVECYTESDTYSTAISVDCSDRENYSPEIADYIPIKKIRVALHIFQKEDEENKENFDADDLDVIYEIFDYVNAVYANLDPVSPGTSIYIPDSRVQFVLDESNIFFWQDDDDWDWSCGFCHDKAEDIYDEYIALNPTMPDLIKNNTLNIFWGGNFPSIVGKVFDAGSKKWLYQTSPFFQYYDGWDGPEKVKDNLAHELAHTLGLNHNFIDTEPDPDKYYCDECADNDGTASICPYKGESNNIMDYWPGSRSAISECQLKKIHWTLMGHAGNIADALIDDYCEIVDPEMVVDDPGNVIEWLHSVYLKGDLRITPTTTLIIKCLVGMPVDSRIIIEKGAKLIIDQGHITNICGELWQGIEVWGQGSGTPHPTIGSILGGSYPATSADHGVVYLKEGSTIEYARNGITTSNYDAFADPSYRGGIIVAHGANFINCRRAAEFMQYDYGDPEIDDDNVSEFYRCNFEVNAAYPCEEPLFAHVSMWDVDGVIFIANTFSDLREEECKNEARGIYSIDATYTVASVVCSGATPCDEEYGYFTGIYRGIQVENANYRPRDIIVSDVIFADNYRGILLSNVDNSLVINNSFSVPDISEPSNNAYGIYFEDCSGYHVENNSFTTYGSYDDASPYNAGMYVVNNSNAQTEVYRNTFSDLEAGIRVQTNNSKLQIKCNTFSDVIAKHDIYVTNTGELANQGKCLDNTYSNCDRVQAPAGNKFLNSWTNNTSDIKLFDGHPELKYKHHTGADYAPTWYTTGATTFVNPIPCSYPDNLGSCYACQSKLPEGGSGYRMSGEAEDQTAYALYQDLLAVKAQIQALEQELLTETEYVLEYDLEMLAESDELDYLSAKMESLLEKVANRYVLENKADSAISILEQEDLEWKSRRIVDIYLMIGDYTSASTALDLLPADVAENAEYKKLPKFN